MNRKKRNNLSRTKLVAVSLAAVISVGIFSVSASAASPTETAYGKIAGLTEFSEETAEGRAYRTEKFKTLASVANKSVSAYMRKSVTVNQTQLSVKGLRINGIDYIPFRQAANAIGASYSYNSNSKNAVMRSRELTLSATHGNYVIYANDRPIFNTSPTVIMSDGRMYIPAEAFSKAVGMKLSSLSGSLSISGSYKPLAKAADFYREDEVFWLARIIHAEARGESLLGEIAVGNVVLNRVRSKDYPNTIYGVVFDKKFGVQFSPVQDGSIYNTPSYTSFLAAKICLEGFDTSEGALFFLRPETSSSSWIPNSRLYLFSIGKHDFYK